MWEIVNQTDATLEIAYKEDGHTLYTAFAKRDGCVDFTRYFNGSKESQSSPDFDKIHFCELDEEIRRLMALRNVIQSTFGEQC